MGNNSPLVSIITVTYNNKTNLEKTVKSIKSLNYTNREFIIIDGGSNDGSVESIKNYKEVISKWVSEEDKGIYDAMNKGIRLAAGNYLWFMNAGDEIFDKNILNEIFNLKENADVYYGDTELVNSEGKSYGKRKLKRPPEKLTWEKMINGMVVTHQSMIVKKSLSPLYNTDYKFCADIDWTINLLKKSVNIINTHKTFCKFQLGGYSRKNTLASLKERFNILTKHFSYVNVIYHQILLGFRFLGHIIRNRKIL
jgi:glycosyltransferase involved in cell wall biosynthesis